MENVRLTVDQLMELSNGFYSREVLDKAWAGREFLTVREFLDMDSDISVEDRVWFLSREGALPSELLKSWAHVAVDRAVLNFATISKDIPVRKWAKDWLLGEATEEQTYNLKCRDGNRENSARAAAYMLMKGRFPEALLSAQNAGGAALLLTALKKIS